MEVISERHVNNNKSANLATSDSRDWHWKVLLKSTSKDPKR